ncbi:MAG: response regulator [Rhodobacteraceae bacterium]|nr:MAG: response regulator [Paracoccaceae bacterium]
MTGRRSILARIALITVGIGVGIGALVWVAGHVAMPGDAAAQIAPLAEDQSRALAARIALAALGLVVALGIALAVAFRVLVTRRIRRLTLAAERAAEGERGIRIGDAGSDAIGALGASLDTLMQKLARQRRDLERQKRLIGMAGEVARFGGWRYQIADKRLIWSDEMAPILDEPPGFVPDLDAGLDYFQSDDRARVAELLQRCLEKGEPYDGVYQLTTAKGRRIWARAVGHPYTSADGTILGAFGAFQDVTELQDMRTREAQQRLIAAEAQKNESIGRLTGGVAHDFNNLLAVIMGNLELLREDLQFPPGDERAEMLESALTATRRGADLTRNMLAFARRAPLTPQRLNLNDLVRATEQIAARTLPATVRIDCSLLANLWPIEADRASIESALLNLIVNASHAMPEGGHITLETSNLRVEEDYVLARHESIAPGRYVMVAVSDTGTGIPPELMPHIFEPFFTTKGPDRGSGLGLSMVQGFVKQSGGTVRVYSEPGSGTTFKLMFPALHDPAAEEAVPETPARGAPPRGARLLLVEDQADVLSALSRTLRRAGYEVVTAISGDAAAALFAQDQAFDLVVTDIVMPGALQGPQLVRRLRSRVPDLPAVFLSGYASEATVHGNGLLPSDIRLMKPLQRADLLAAVARALSGASGRA